MTIANAAANQPRDLNVVGDSVRGIMKQAQ